MKENRKGFRVFVIALAVAIIGMLISGTMQKKDSDNSEIDIVMSKNKKNSLFEQALGKSSKKMPNINGDYIAVLYICGVISEANKTYNQDWILETIDTLKNDEKNKGIMLYIDSPGGTVYESDETYLALVDYKNSTERPVYSYFSSLAASGGYYIGCAADKIYANRNCLTGSIGVIAGQSMDMTGLFDKIGIKSTTITAGKNKNMLNYNSPLTQEQRDIMQSIADDAYEQFTRIVSVSRKMDIDAVRTLADGRIYTAKQASANGLIDDVCQLAEAKDKMKEIVDAKDVEFVDFEYEYTYSFMDMLSDVSTAVSNPKAAFENKIGRTGAMSLNYLYR